MFDRNTPVIPRDDDALAGDDEILAGERVTPSFADEILLPDEFLLPDDVTVAASAPAAVDLGELDQILADATAPAAAAATTGNAAADDAMAIDLDDLDRILAEEETREGRPDTASAQEASTGMDAFLDELNLADGGDVPPQPSAAKQPSSDDDEIPDFEIPDEAGETIGRVNDAAPAPPQPLFAPPGGDMFATSAPVEEVIAQLGDMRTRIAAGDKKKYIKKIFNRDAEAYEQAMDAINARSTWREASELIDDVFIRFNIDMYSRIAVKFTDDIYRRYSQNKG